MSQTLTITLTSCIEQRVKARKLWNVKQNRFPLNSAQWERITPKWLPPTITLVLSTRLREIKRKLWNATPSHSIRLNTLGENHPNVANSFNNRGVMYKDRGDNQKALECHLKSLSIHLNTLGEDHPNVATSYNNIDNVYKVNNELEKALEYYTKSLSIRQ